MDANIQFKIYYDDGSTFDNLDGTFDHAPTDGVIVIANRVGPVVEFLTGADYYVRFGDDGTIVATGDINPLLRKLGYVKFGRYTSHRNHNRIVEHCKQEWS